VNWVESGSLPLRSVGGRGGGGRAVIGGGGSVHACISSVEKPRGGGRQARRIVFTPNFHISLLHQMVHRFNGLVCITPTEIQHDGKEAVQS
jgi:hypothetical protein